MVSRQAWRKAWWQAHKWIGLALMIFLIPLGLSGIVLAWDDAIDHAINPQRYAVHGGATLQPSAYAAAASQTLQPGERLSQIRYPKDDGPVVVMAMGAPGGGKHDGAKNEGGKHASGGKGRHGPLRRATIWLDPQSGRVLDVMRGDTGLVRFAHNFHGMLFIPGGPGRALVGLLGIAMFLMALGGVWLWWPPIGQWVKGLRWQRGDRRLDTNLHHRVGFWIALPLAAQAFTGVWMAWPQMMSTIGLGAARVGPMERARMVPAADTRLTVDQALVAAQAAVPGKPVSVAWPVGDDGPWRISLRGKGGDMQVDDATGAATPAPPRGDGGLAMAMRHYHDGTTLGPIWRVLMVLWGLAPTVLGITGVMMWLRGRRWRADLAKRRDEREPVAAS
jgi:uncharacterized iron-regulated membrane protein